MMSFKTSPLFMFNAYYLIRAVVTLPIPFRPDVDERGVCQNRQRRRRSPEAEPLRRGDRRREAAEEDGDGEEHVPAQVGDGHDGGGHALQQDPLPTLRPQLFQEGRRAGRAHHGPLHRAQEAPGQAAVDDRQRRPLPDRRPKVGERLRGGRDDRHQDWRARPRPERRDGRPERHPVGRAGCDRAHGGRRCSGLSAAEEQRVCPAAAPEAGLRPLGGFRRGRGFDAVQVGPAADPGSRGSSQRARRGVGGQEQGDRAAAAAAQRPDNVRDG